MPGENCFKQSLESYIWTEIQDEGFSAPMGYMF